MVGAAGLLQIGAATANVVLLWRYLPTRDAECSTMTTTTTIECGCA